MKLKPLLKTHWVASQNPLTVSLSGLQRLVVTVPKGLLSFEFGENSENAIDLPMSQSDVEILKPDAAEARDARIQSFALSKDVFWSFFSGHDLNYSGASADVIRRISQSLEFHFEDGQKLLLPGVFRRSHFPLFLSPQYYFQDSSTNWSRAHSSQAEELLKPLKISAHQKKQEDLRKSWFVILEILAWALQRKRQVGDLEILFVDPKSKESGKAYHLDEVEFSKELPLAAVVQNSSPLHARLQVWQNHQEPSNEGCLRLHSVEVLRDLENSFSNSDVSENNSQVHSESLPMLQPAHAGRWSLQFVTSEMASEEILKAVSRIEGRLGANRIFYQNHKLIQASDFQPVLKAWEDEGCLQLSVAFRMPSVEMEHLNFPSSLRQALGPFYGGLDTCLHFDRKLEASRQIQFRTNDLLFLRHQGLLLFCLFEMINWVLGRPLSSGENIEFEEDMNSAKADQQFEKFLHYLQSSIPALLGKPETAYRNLVSPRAQEIFLNFIEKIHAALVRDRSFVFLDGKAIEIRNVQSRVLPILRFVILQMIESSSGKFLTRSQAPLGEKFLAALQAWTQPQLNSLKNENSWVSALAVDLGRFEKSSISLLFELLDEGFEIELNGSSLLNQQNPFEFKFSVTDSASDRDGNWFDLHPEVFFNGQRISSEEVKLNFGQGQVGFIEYHGQIYRIDKKQLPSLKSLQRFWRKIKGLRGSDRSGKLEDRSYRLEKSQALELLMLKFQGFEIQVEGEWKKVFDYFENGLGTEKIELPEGVRTALLPHQREGVQWLHDLYELKLGAILADEMGLGKTFQVLSFLISLQNRDQLGRNLIIVPTSLVYNWMDEKKKFAPDLPMRIYQSSEQEKIKREMAESSSYVLVSTYGQMIENPDFFQSQSWNVLAFDESQALKNMGSLRSTSARKLKARFKVCVTGTPMENNYMEFYSLCDLVVPGCLGSVENFRREYVNREVRAESLRELKLISKPLLLRRTKQQVKLNLPAKTIQKVSLPFEEKQRDIYKKMAMTYSKQVEDLIRDQGEKKAQIAMFAALMRLRQICSDPAAVPGVDYPQRPVKVEHFLNSLQDHLESQESVVVFTQFLSTLGRLRSEMEKMGIPVFTLQGNVSAKERIRLISDFQNSSEPGVMLMTLKTGGVGLNLTKASVVYHLEPWWNPAVENQATDRAHRMGQTKDVKVFNLLIEGSLEERIADLKLKKQDSFDRLFGFDEEFVNLELENSQSLSREDFVYLLK